MGINDCFNLAEKIFNTFSSKHLRDESTKQIIAQVTSSEKIGVFEKQQIANAIIYNANTLKIKNKADIIQKAVNILKEKDPELLSGVKHIDDGWFLNFFDCCENTIDDNMKTIWAKILVGECEKKGSISKRLLSILSIIDKTSAETFGVLCDHSVKIITEDNIENLEFIFPKIIYTSDNDIINDFLSSFNIDYKAISELINIGLLETTETAYSYPYNNIKLNYYNTEILIKRIDGENYIDVGSYSFTKCGLELANALYDAKISKKDEKYISFLIEYYSNYLSPMVRTVNKQKLYSVKILEKKN